MKQKVSTMERFPPAGTGRQARSARERVESASPQLELPSERDTRPAMTDGISSEIIEQGHRDLARGLVDTDKAEQMNGLYRRVKRQPPRTTVLRRSTAPDRR